MHGNIQTKAKLQEASVEAVVIRCGCGDPARHRDTPCQQPRAIEDRGVIAYYHRNPLKRLAWRLRRLVGMPQKPLGA
jgi:hypothetical protein